MITEQQWPSLFLLNALKVRETKEKRWREWKKEKRKVNEEEGEKMKGKGKIGRRKWNKKKKGQNIW